MSKVAFRNMIVLAAYFTFLALLSAAPTPQKAFDFNFPNGFPGPGYGFPGGRFGYSGPGFQFNGNGFNGYSFNSLSILANGSIYNSATGDMINGFLVPSSSNNNNNNFNFATNSGIDVRVG